jgi:uncharacterized membrane protein
VVSRKINKIFGALLPQFENNGIAFEMSMKKNTQKSQTVAKQIKQSKSI